MLFFSVASIAQMVISLVGVSANVLMLVTLRRDVELRQRFGRSLRIVLSTHASSDVLFSLVALPLWTLQHVRFPIYH